MQVSLKKEETKQKEAFYSANVALLSKGNSPLNALPLNDENSPATQAEENNISPKNQQSVSRLLALISGIVSVGLSCCITSFYLWRYVNEKGDTDLTHIVNVLLVLGIGVLPYGFNKFSNII